MHLRSSASVRCKSPGNVGAGSAVIAMAVASLLCAACRPLEQGFWAKPGMSQTRSGVEYSRDSEECARESAEQVALNNTPEGEAILTRHPPASDPGANRYGKCMITRGYEWVKLQPLVPPAPHGEASKQAPCPAEQIMLDPFGYPHCLTANQGHRAGPANGFRETGAQDSVPAASPAPSNTAAPTEQLAHENVPVKQAVPDPSAGIGDNKPSLNGRAPVAQRADDNRLCIQQSQQSLSNPYDTYLHCMEEKGWPALPR